MIFFFLFSCFFILSLSSSCPCSLTRSYRILIFFRARILFSNEKIPWSWCAVCVCEWMWFLSLVLAVYLEIVLVSWVPNINSVIHTRHMGYVRLHRTKELMKNHILRERKRRDDLNLFWTRISQQNLRWLLCIRAGRVRRRALSSYMSRTHCEPEFRLENIEWKRNILNFQRETNRVEFNQCLCIFITFHWNLLRFLIKIAFFFQI